MSTALRTRIAQGALRPGELHAEWRPYHQPVDGSAAGVVVGLSHNAVVSGYFQPPYDQEIRAIAAAGMAVVVPGSSGWSWGNDEAVDSIDRAVGHLRGELGCRRRVGLLGFSMGALAVCGWARRHPGEVTAIALVTPAVDLVDLHRRGLFTDEIEDAFGGPAGVEAALPTHDPCTFASELQGIPIRAWYSSDDPLIAWSSVFRFAERHGGAIDLCSLGARAHDPTAADGDEIASFLAAHR